MQANRNIRLCQKKAPIYKLFRSKAPKRSKLAITDIRQKPVDFFNIIARASTLALAIIFKIQVPWQKFPFLLRTIIPCRATDTDCQLCAHCADNYQCRDNQYKPESNSGAACFTNNRSWLIVWQYLCCGNSLPWSLHTTRRGTYFQPQRIVGIWLQPQIHKLQTHTGIEGEVRATLVHNVLCYYSIRFLCKINSWQWLDVSAVQFTPNLTGLSSMMLI